METYKDKWATEQDILDADEDWNWFLETQDKNSSSIQHHSVSQEEEEQDLGEVSTTHSMADHKSVGSSYSPFTQFLKHSFGFLSQIEDDPAASDSKQEEKKPLQSKPSLSGGVAPPGGKKQIKKNPGVASSSETGASSSSSSSSSSKPNLAGGVASSSGKKQIKKKASSPSSVSETGVDSSSSSSSSKPNLAGGVASSSGKKQIKKQSLSGGDGSSSGKKQIKKQSLSGGDGSSSGKKQIKKQSLSGGDGSSSGKKQIKKQPSTTALAGASASGSHKKIKKKEDGSAIAPTSVFALANVGDLKDSFSFDGKQDPLQLQIDPHEHPTLFAMLQMHPNKHNLVLTFMNEMFYLMNLGFLTNNLAKEMEKKDSAKFEGLEATLQAVRTQWTEQMKKHSDSAKDIKNTGTFADRIMRAASISLGLFGNKPKNGLQYFVDLSRNVRESMKDLDRQMSS